MREVLSLHLGSQSEFESYEVRGMAVLMNVLSLFSSSKIKAGIGGGVAALVALGLILLFSRRKSRRKTNAVELDLIDPDVKDPSLFHRASASLSTTFKPGHHRHHSSFSESATSPISPVKPVYARFMGQKHPFQQLPS